MLSADDVLIPMMRDEVEKVLRAHLGAVDVTCTGHQIIAKHAGREAVATAGPVDNVFSDAQKIASELEVELTK